MKRVIFIAAMIVALVAKGQGNKEKDNLDEFVDSPEQKEARYDRYKRDTAVHDWFLGVLPMKENKVVYTAIIPVNNTSIDQIYTRTKLWYVSIFNSANNVIQIDDKEKGRVVGSGLSVLFWKFKGLGGITGKVSMIIDVSIKSNRVKLEIRQLYLNDSPIEKYDRYSNWQEKKLNLIGFIKRIDLDMRNTIASFEEAVNSDKLTKQDNW